MPTNTMTRPARNAERITRLRTLSRPNRAIPHVAQLQYQTAHQDDAGNLTWIDRGVRVARVAVADQATADSLPYTPIAYALVNTPTNIDYTDVAVGRVAVVVTNEAGSVFTSHADFYPELPRNTDI